MARQPSRHRQKTTNPTARAFAQAVRRHRPVVFVPMDGSPYSIRMMSRHGSMTRAPALLASLGIVCVVVLGSAPTAVAAEKVTYLLPAPITLPAFGPWVVAQQRGYYAAEGLEVDFQTANGGADVAKQVGVGNAVIGGATGDTSIIVRGNGVPVKSVALLGGGGLT